MNIGIIGCGAYAIALASIIEEKNINILMWTKIKEEYEELKNNHTNLKVIDYKKLCNIDKKSQILHFLLLNYCMIK